MADLLIELGCEELPAGSVMALAEHLGSALHTVLKEAVLCSSGPRVFATPRRIAVRFSSVAERQADSMIERRGPAKLAAFKDGEPTKALQGFMRSAGVSVDQLVTIQTPKGEWIAVQQKQAGQALSSVLAQALPGVIKNMPMPKRMRWGNESHEFLRPVVWLLAMHGSHVLPLEVLGLTAGNQTRGHRFHAPHAITLGTPAEYESVLKAAYVLADASERRNVIVNAVQQVAEQLGGTPVMDEGLVDEVNCLVEWPVALAGRFDEEFLEIPPEALIQTMQENQRYFALTDKHGTLMPAFVTIANLESTSPAVVIDGNERVIRPRFADTMFFWKQDKKRTLASHQAELSRLLFEEKLGSVANKVERMQLLARLLADQLDVSQDDVQLAVSLCKCDLNTELVKELAKMQGICGRYYALRDGHPVQVAEAMEQHYFPKQAGGPLPQGSVSQIVSLADKTDTLCGIFGLGMKPTGAKDPFGLRRASLGIVRIAVEKGLDLDLASLITASIGAYGTRLKSPDPAAILDYVIERMRGYLVDRGYAADAVDAVLAKDLSSPLDIVARLDAIERFRKTPAAFSLAAASKRISNILKKVDFPVPQEVASSALKETAESALFNQLQHVQPAINAYMQTRDYQSAMMETATLREPVDTFFDEVMVMDEDARLRDNRLALLTRVNALCCATAELSCLQSSDRLVES